MSIELKIFSVLSQTFLKLLVGNHFYYCFHLRLNIKDDAVNLAKVLFITPTLYESNLHILSCFSFQQSHMLRFDHIYIIRHFTVKIFEFFKLCSVVILHTTKNFGVFLQRLFSNFERFQELSNFHRSWKPFVVFGLHSHIFFGRVICFQFLNLQPLTGQLSRTPFAIKLNLSVYKRSKFYGPFWMIMTFNFRGYVVAWRQNGRRTVFLPPQDLREFCRVEFIRRHAIGRPTILPIGLLGKNRRSKRGVFGMEACERSYLFGRSHSVYCQQLVLCQHQLLYNQMLIQLNNFSKSF